MSKNLDKNWLVGFVDGEGCFFVGINKNKTMLIGEQVIPEFRIVQHNRDLSLLYDIQNYFNCGYVTYNRGLNSISSIMEYRVRDLGDLSKIIIPFFKENRLLTVKHNSFLIFSEIIDLMLNKQHLTPEGLLLIKQLKIKMNKT